MKGYLLDTNVLSSLRRLERLEPNVVLAIDSLPRSECFVSVVVLMEVEIGIRLMERRDARQGAVLRRWIERHRPTIAENLILPVTEPIALRCASLGIPNPRPLNDALIAATALVHDLTLVTRNVSDFRGIEGLRILDPWNF